MSHVSSSRMAIRSAWTASRVVALFVGWSALGHAAPPTKDACLDAYSRAQDAQAEGKLSAAHELFLDCAQAGCPSVVQSECAKQTEIVEQAQPTVNFVARDSRGTDLADTIVYVDGKLLAKRMEGQNYALDPGQHAARFVHQGREVSVEVVLTQGEKGRAVVVTFPAPEEKHRPAVTSAVAGRPTGPLWVAGAGALLVVAGTVITVVGVARVPASCHFWDSRGCAVPPGDEAIGTAQAAVKLANAGLGAGIAGAAVLSAGLVWYYSLPKRTVMSLGSNRIAPWFTQSGGGLMLQGALD